MSTSVRHAASALTVIAAQVLLCYSLSSHLPVLAETTEVETVDEVDLTVSSRLDAKTTSDMHNDNTILRNVEVATKDEEGVVLFDALRIWAGGAMQYDYHSFDGIYHNAGDGERDSGGAVRRMEIILRTQLYDWGEAKFQYDLYDGTARDIYVRWVSDLKPVTVTIGNQKEPMGLDYLTGNKFGFPQEHSLPADGFGAWRSMGVRLHRAYEFGPGDHKLNIWEPSDSPYVTTSIGVFTKDLEDSHETDHAVTGRVTTGRYSNGIGKHFGLSASYRRGEFDQIRVRPEIRSADRIRLASPVANTLGVVAVEGAYSQGPFTVQAEAYGADYGGSINGNGIGSYALAAWSITGEQSIYQTKWGTFAPVRPRNGRYSAQAFVRLSYARGEDDIDGWNDFKSLTVGGSVFYRHMRASVNLLYGKSRTPVNNEDEGAALNIRAQYIF